MKNKNKLLKLFLIVAIALALPAVHSAPSFTTYANSIVVESGDGTDDKGGNTTKDGGKGGGGSGGSILTTILDGLRTILSGVGGGISSTSA